MRAHSATDHPVPATRAGLSGHAVAGGVIAGLQLLDLVLVAIAVPVALGSGAPVLGCLVGAGGWLSQRALAVVDRRLIAKAAAPGSRLGPDVLQAFARIRLLPGPVMI